MSERPRRLVFGEIAELYDAARPSYPGALVDDLVEWASAGEGPPVALEVGAGTGKATRLMAARGVAVLAVEPSAEMAAVARRTTAETGLVEVLESDFEHAQLGERRFGLVYAGQAWHWVAQPAGYARARGALVHGGWFVAFWNRPAWGRSALREALDAVYASYAPDMEPGLARPGGLEEYDRPDWTAEIAGVDGFGEPEVRGYEWSLRYTADEYVDLVATHSEVRQLDDGTRQALLAAIREAVDCNGGSFELGMHVRACIALAQ